MNVSERTTRLNDFVVGYLYRYVVAKCLIDMMGV